VSAQQEQQCVVVGTRKRACHFWSPGGVRCRPQRAASAAAALAAAALAAARTNHLLLL